MTHLINSVQPEFLLMTYLTIFIVRKTCVDLGTFLKAETELISVAVVENEQKVLFHVFFSVNIFFFRY